MTTATSAHDDRTYAEKIAKLLRKAENPGATAEEAEAFITKAQELMTKYAIEEALVNAARIGSAKVAEKIVRDQIVYRGGYAPAQYDIGAAIARANDCRVLISKYRGTQTLILNGFESDVARVKMLDASVQIQATGAVTKWARTKDMSWMTASQRYIARRDFLFGFAQGLASQLSEAKERGQAEAQREDVQRGGAANSVALVVKDRKERLNEWMDETYGKLRTTSRNYSRGFGGGTSAGYSAGRSADVSGKGGVGGGNSRQLGR